MKGVRKFKDKLKEELKNTEFRKAFEEEEIFASIAVSLAKLREKEGLTQTDLAKRMHTSQQMVARLENLSNKSFSLKTLAKAASALNKRLVIKFI
ncbi:MAG: helix-turn-helix transcriptional regulator [Candidatus Tantalella remota]|nr:helix-turn-helix transcriptional regulator [Candidatus Tantalella remota]